MVEITIRKRPAAASNELVQRKFFKKTARGKVLKVLRERYVRDDISCGSLACSSCQPPTSGLHKARPCLSAEGIRGNKAVANPHYILPDTNVFLREMDLIESSAFVDVIVLQNILDEVRHRSLPIYNRLRALIQDPDRRFWIFYNDILRDTCIVRKEKETPNDYNDRAIRGATEWYAAHLKTEHLMSGASDGESLEVVLLTNDAENRRLAQENKLVAFSVRDYVEGMPQAGELLDLLAAPGPSDGSIEKKTVLYPGYYPTASLMAGIKSGALHQGYFHANAYNYLEGSVNVPALEKPVLLVGREHMNRAVSGDVVAVEVFPEDQWQAPADEVIDQDAALRNDDAEASEGEEGASVEDEEAKLAQKERAAARAEAEIKNAGRQPTGRVVGIIKRNWRAYVCHIDRASVNASTLSAKSQQSLFATPIDRLIPRIRLRTRQASQLLDQKIVVAIDRWEPTSRYPEGHFVRALGRTESKDAEQESLLLEHDVPYRPFSKAILDCLPPEGDSWVVPEKDMSNPAWKDRVDLRTETICSIDPPGCEDIDDALHAKRLPNGNIEAGVHIADVSYFVKPDTPMDAEAASRGTTVYLVDKRIDMLPSLLGTNLCSLRPDVERLAFSAIWEMTPEADIVNVRFHKSVIASKAAFTYEEAQMRKDDPNMNDAITESIRLLNGLARQLKAKRMAAGALNLASPEVKIHLESAESTEPIDVEQKELRETNSLVEEFMLLANVSVAEKIYETFPQTAVLRRHGVPPRTNFETLQDILAKRKGFHVDVSSSGALAASLDKCVDANEPAFNTLVRIMATRCMLSAEYFCSGSVARSAFGHYGLACGMYTHFTSPIRRFADVLAHRQLAAAISYEPLHASLHSKPHVENILKVVNKRHLAAQRAGRASVEFYVALAIAAKNHEATAKGEKEGGEDKVAVREEAFVIRTFRNGLAVFVSKFGLEGLITFKQECQFDAENYTVTVPAKASGLSEDLTVGVFDKCKVEIGVKKDRSTQRGRVRMALVGK